MNAMTSFRASAKDKNYVDGDMTYYGVVNLILELDYTEANKGGDGSGQSEHGDDAIVEKKCVLFDEDGRPVGGKSAEFSSSLGEINRAHASIVFQTKKRILTLRPVTRTVLYVALHTNDNGTCPIEEHCVEVDLIEFSRKTPDCNPKNATIGNATIKLIGARYTSLLVRIRLESIIDSVNKILEEANKRIQPTGTVELFGDLRGRLYDSNKNLVMATLVVGGVASAMGPMVEKSSKIPVSVQDLAVQSQALFNIKDSNKDDRERMVVRRYKFEEPRLEQIQDLDLYHLHICECFYCCVCGAVGTRD
ncbi:hypothetical protein IFM89_021852 [Coptis chinensis]|uniref:Uncharacterized protein n=1 Tax=Coptis chinensis TaxID=261450 RepID=A0A835I2V7_9MAGN|nr:hypothetical protein IFM89_021852 [Coptis chinensis]